MFRSIRFKLIVPLVVGLGVIALAIAVLMRFVHQRGVDQAALHEVQQVAAALDTIEAAEEDRLSRPPRRHRAGRVAGGGLHPR